MVVGPHLSRRSVLAASAASTLAAVGLAGQTASAADAPSCDNAKSGRPWNTVKDVTSAGWSSAKLAEMEMQLYPLATTSMMVVQGGEIVYRYGNLSDVSYLASARKSILSMLFGRYVAEGRIDLNMTIGGIGIEEDDGLLPAEKTAKVKDLLTSSSGVYHAAGSPGGNSNTPERGRTPAGSVFLYNNWDFNVLGAIFEKQTGKTVFAALKEDLAEPLGFQDFDIGRQRMMGYENQSRYLAYHLFLSARDMARLGQLMLQGGKWDGKTILPESWVSESTKMRFTPEQTKSKEGLGYGYLWWIPTSSDPAFKGSYLMNGNFGQFVLCLPAIDAVIVHRRAVTDEFALARNLGKTTYEPAKVSVGEFLKIAEAVVAART
ncbi:CubicO group peptidase (beta-lactamase class C family) [Neorhizobium galegae]|uniref:serine hydrolase domain-containing protein n=1 Tax=Neorhizobium galegae TaxID=399 RepID=UPI001AE7DAAE|nr:serine hydrolase [Neorhizobium galegae]MBP2557261.1 CubicO group peptidase (beta-lactamase class C family) [Neorhizobium galegae]MDQ0138248.1 CubicO group peptidase (beta-lactamase class C family) [Neorhizobium galegae]